MNIACLCATFGRPKYVANQIATFLGQSYPADKRRLLILDDGDQISGEGEGWRIVSVGTRFSTLPDKYTAMLCMLNMWWPEWEAVTIMDDDDFYGPDWLQSHANALKSAAWSHPKQVLTFYKVDAQNGEPPRLESAAGRFWATAAVTRPLLELTGGFYSNPSTAFDQDYLASWRHHGGEPGDASQDGPQFCYGWGRSDHDSALQNANPTWKPTTSRLDPTVVPNMQPHMDEQTTALWRTVWKRKPESLTIGMAVYEDYDGVYFTIQSLRYYHQDADFSRIKFLVVDNCPDGKHSRAIKDLLEKPMSNGKYVCTDKIKGTAVRDFIFEEAETELVLCMDSHVLVEPGAIKALLQYYDDNPLSNDLLQGPLLYDDLHHISTHFKPEWRSGMYGTWSTDPRAEDKNAEPFDIPAQGLGLFSCRKQAWLGFNRRFSGFGGEEFYIHEKFRQAGRRALCLPFLRWMHRFDRPNGTQYRNVWEDRIRNYIIGWRELGLPIHDIIEHFSSIIGEDKVLNVLKAVAAEEVARMEE